MHLNEFQASYWMVNGKCIEAVKSGGRKEDASFSAPNLSKKVLLLVIVARRHVARLTDEQ